MHVEEDYAPWHFSIILTSLRIEVAQISDFLVQAKILAVLKSFFQLKSTTLCTGQKRYSSYFLYLISHGLL